MSVYLCIVLLIQDDSDLRKAAVDKWNQTNEKLTQYLRTRATLAEKQGTIDIKQKQQFYMSGQ